MTSDRWEKIKLLFDGALEVGTADRDAHAHLKEACGDDAGLHSEVDRLLREFDNAGGFLTKSPFETVSSLSIGETVDGRYGCPACSDAAVWVKSTKRKIRSWASRLP